MADHLPNNGNIVQQVEEIFNTYRTPFWFNEHHYRSIRRLDLMHSSDWGCLENIELSLLANSSLGRQCEVLLIKVSVQENIFDLINTMSNLRALACSIISLQQLESNYD
ncbi:unnamed protein product, partial [Rotaria sordida]